MTKTNYLLCPGDACPLRLSCNRHQKWLNRDDEEYPEMTPDYHEGECYAFEPREFYGG